MSTPAEAIGRHLADEGVGAIQATSGWCIDIAAEPTSPDTAITLYDSGGRDALLYDEALRQPTIQVRVRATDYLANYAKQTAIVDALHTIIGAEIYGHRYVGIWQTGDIQSLGRDDNNRYVTTSNFQIIREPIAQEA